MVPVTFLLGVPGKGLDLYHIGLTVPSLQAAMQQYSTAFGLDWASVHQRTPTVIVDGERREADISVTYSLHGPPYLELVEEGSSTIWGSEGFALTHVGFWAEDVVAAKRGLEVAGMRARVHAEEKPDAPMRYSYHEFGGGLWIELVHTSFRAQLADWIGETLDRLK
jgi:Glyoxalase/Bleomycin resistance protein/Dioxygenase superfamily